MKKTPGLADRAGILVLGSSAQSVCVTLLLVGLTRLFDKSHYGQYRQVWLVYNLATPVLVLGVPASMLYFLPRLEPGAWRGFLRRTALLLTGLGACLSAGLWFGAPLVGSAFHDPRLVPLVRVFAPYPVLAFPAVHISQVLVARGSHHLAAAYAAGAGVFQLAAVLGAAWVTHSVPFSLGAAVLAALLPLFVALILVERSPAAPGARQSPSLREHLLYSLPLAFSGLVLPYGRQIGRLAISLVYPAGDFAQYDVAAFEIPFVSLFAGSIMTTLLPVFSRLYYEGERNQLMRLWHESIRKLSLLLFPLFVVLFVLADQVVVLLFSEKYAASAPIFRIFLLVLPLRVTIYSGVLQATGKTYVLSIGAIGFLLGCTGLSLALLGPLGIAGPAIAYVVSMYGLAAYFLLQVNRVVGVGVGHVFPWGEVNRCFLVAAVLGVSLYPLTRLSLHPALIIAVGSSAYLGIYAWTLFRCRLVNPSDIELLKRWATLSAFTR